MWLSKYLTSLTKPELEALKELLNLTDDEEKVFNEMSRGRSIVMTSEKCMVSTSTVDNRVKAIKSKIKKVAGDSFDGKRIIASGDR